MKNQHLVVVLQEMIGPFLNVVYPLSDYARKHHNRTHRQIHFQMIQNQFLLCLLPYLRHTRNFPCLRQSESPQIQVPS